MQRVRRRHYTNDFKAQAIALAESSGSAKAARQLDMSVKTLGNWLDASRAGRPLSSPQRKPVSEVESELAQLPQIAPKKHTAPWWHSGWRRR
ncbi:MAG: transposase [Rhodanobacter sp.]|nr:transposase [Rhodanobacter sp.]